VGSGMAMRTDMAGISLRELGAHLVDSRQG